MGSDHAEPESEEWVIDHVEASLAALLGFSEWHLTADQPHLQQAL